MFILISPTIPYLCVLSPESQQNTKQRVRKEREKEKVMVGDFMVCMDRIIASACFEGSGASESGAQAAEVREENKSRNSAEKKRNSGKSKGKAGGEAVECRICQEEGEEDDMESPCACTGTLKFAHRKCIQRWCNKKGSITCEICNQIYTPNYSIPLARTCSDMLAIDIRQSWGPLVGDQDSRFLAIAVAEQELLQAEYEGYSASSSSVACCRAVAVIMMLLLLIRHILLITRDISALQDASALFNASLQFAGFFLPCYVIARSSATLCKAGEEDRLDGYLNHVIQSKIWRPIY